MKVLIAHDGSPCADAALDDLTRAGLGDDVEATVLCVADVWLDTAAPPAVRGFDEGLLASIAASAERARAHAMQEVARARELAHRVAATLRTRFPAWRVTDDACAGAPAWEIVRRAETQRLDLIVLGSHGRSRLGRLLLGSVSQRVAEEAACSVRVARPRGGGPSAPLRLLVGVDGSEDAQAAVDAIRSRHWPAATSVLVVGVLDPVIVSAFGSLVPPLVHWVEEMNADETEALHAVLTRACAGLAEAGLEAVPSVVTGKPSPALLRVARRRDVDGIFIGARGLRRIERFFLGSVSSAVAARARCSVEIVRPLSCRSSAAPLASTSAERA